MAMTIKRQSVRCISGIALLGLFLGFVAVSGFLGGYEFEAGAGDVTLTATVAEPLAFRHSTNPGFVPAFCLKAAGACLLLARFGFAKIVRLPGLHASALKVNLPRYNTFYVFVTTNAP